MRLLHTQWFRHPETGVPVVFEFDMDEELIYMRLYCAAFEKLNFSREDDITKTTGEICRRFHRQCSSLVEANRILAEGFPDLFRQGVCFEE